MSQDDEIPTGNVTISRNVGPPQAPEVFIDERYSLMVCKACGVCFSSIANHLKTYHTKIPKNDRIELLRKYTRSQGEESTEIISTLAAPIHAIPFLNKSVAYACSECNYVGPTPDAFRKHRSTSHAASDFPGATSVTSTLTLAQNVNSQSTRWVPVYLDPAISLLTDKNAIREALHADAIRWQATYTATTATPSQRPSMEALTQRFETMENALAAATEVIAPNGDDGVIQIWDDRLHLTEHLKNLRFTDVYESVSDMSNADAGMYSDHCDWQEWFLDYCVSGQFSHLYTLLSESAQYGLAPRTSRDEVSTKPMRLIEGDSMHKYAKVMLRFAAMICRGINSTDCQGIYGFTCSDDTLQVYDGLIEATRQWKEDENPDTIESLRAATVHFYTHFLWGEAYYTTYDSTLMHFIAALHVQQHSPAFRPVRQMTQFFAIINHFARIFLVHTAFGDCDHDCASVEEKINRQGYMLDCYVDNFYSDGPPRVLTHIGRLFAFASSIAVNTALDVTAYADLRRQSVTYSKFTVKVDDLRAGVSAMLKAAEALFWNDLMLGTEKFTVDLTTIKDSFSDPQWPLWRMAPELDGRPARNALYLIRQVYDKPNPPRLFNSENMNLNPVQGDRYLANYEKFSSMLVVLCQMLWGMPARGTEIAAMRLASDSTWDRAAHIWGADIAVIAYYNKTQSIRGHPSIVARVLPPAMSQLFFLYQSVVRPLALHVKMQLVEIFEQGRGITKLVENQKYLFLDGFKPWTTSNMSHYYNMYTTIYFGGGFHFQAWRHLAIGFDRNFAKAFDEESLIASNCLAPNGRIVSEDASILQAGHGASADQRYAVTEEMRVLGRSAFQLEQFLQASKKWWDFLEVGYPRDPVVPVAAASSSELSQFVVNSPGGQELLGQLLTQVAALANEVSSLRSEMSSSPFVNRVQYMSDGHSPAPMYNPATPIGFTQLATSQPVSLISSGVYNHGPPSSPCPAPRSALATLTPHHNSVPSSSGRPSSQTPIKTSPSSRLLMAPPSQHSTTPRLPVRSKIPVLSMSRRAAKTPVRASASSPPVVCIPGSQQAVPIVLEDSEDESFSVGVDDDSVDFKVGIEHSAPSKATRPSLTVARSDQTSLARSLAKRVSSRDEPVDTTSSRSPTPSWRDTVKKSGDVDRHGYIRVSRPHPSAHNSKQVPRLQPELAEVALRCLRQAVGKPEAQFRSVAQRHSLEAVLCGASLVVSILPTAGGKTSLITAPLYVKDSKCVVVVSPYVRLAEDLVARFRAGGIKAEMWHKGVGQKRWRILVVVANTAVGEAFLKAYGGWVSEGRIDRIVFDETHAPMFEGTEFRPELIELSKLSKWGVPQLHLTATLPPSLLSEYEDTWAFKFKDSGHCYIRGRTRRRNIKYTVETTRGRIDKRTSVPYVQEKIREAKLAKGEKCIVFVMSTSFCVELGEVMDLPYYHSTNQMSVEDGRQMQEVYLRWASGEGPNTIVATSALGTGIDMLGVKLVIHLEGAWGLMEFVQQSGRAAREDGSSGHSICWVNEGKLDPEKWKPVSRDDKKPQSAQREHDRAMLLEYLSRNDQCRRRVLDWYLDDISDAKCEANDSLCDFCARQRSCSRKRSAQEMYFEPDADAWSNHMGSKKRRAGDLRRKSGGLDGSWRGSSLSHVVDCDASECFKPSEVQNEASFTLSKRLLEQAQVDMGYEERLKLLLKAVALDEETDSFRGCLGCTVLWGPHSHGQVDTPCFNDELIAEAHRLFCSVEGGGLSRGAPVHYSKYMQNWSCYKCHLSVDQCTRTVDAADKDRVSGKAKGVDKSCTHPAMASQMIAAMAFGELDHLCVEISAFREEIQTFVGTEMDEGEFRKWLVHEAPEYRLQHAPFKYTVYMWLIMRWARGWAERMGYFDECLCDVV